MKQSKIIDTFEMYQSPRHRLSQDGQLDTCYLPSPPPKRTHLPSRPRAQTKADDTIATGQKPSTANHPCQVHRRIYNTVVHGKPPWLDESEQRGASEGAIVEEGRRQSKNPSHQKIPITDGPTHSKPHHPIAMPPRRGQCQSVAAAKTERFWFSPRIQEGKEGVLDGASKEEDDILRCHHRRGHPQAKDFSRSPNPTHEPTHSDPATKVATNRIQRAKKLGTATTF